MTDVVVGFKGEDKGAGDLVDELGEDIRQLTKSVKDLSGQKIDFAAEGAIEDVEELQREFRRLSREFDRASKTLSLRNTRNELEGTKASARALTRAQVDLVARGQELVKFSKQLPPELRQMARGLDRVEDEANQAARSFRRLSDAQKRTKNSSSSLISSLNNLRTALGGVAAVASAIVFGRIVREFVDLAKAAVEVKLKFDALPPTLKAFTGSAAVAEDVIGELNRLTNELKTPLSGLVQPFSRITAATKETNLSLTEQINLFESALLTTKAFGLTASETSRLITGFAQVAGKGALCVDEGVEIRGVDGWKARVDLRVGDAVAQMGEDGVVYGAVEALYHYPATTTEVIMRLGGAEVGMTGGHRVITTEGVRRARDLIGVEALIPGPDVTRRATFETGGDWRGVWCPKTSTGTWLARKNGVEFFTGNSMEELRQQIGEVAFNALPALAKELGVTTKVLVEQVSSGAIDASTALRGLSEGLRKANEEAGRGRLDTLEGDLGAVANAAEKARKNFADGLEPALRRALQATNEFLTENEALIKSLGRGVGSIVDFGASILALRERFAGTSDEAKVFRADLQVLVETLSQLTGIRVDKLTQSFNEAKAAAQEFQAQAVAATERIEKAAREAAEGTVKSALEIQEAFEKAFREQAEAAGAAAEDITKTEDGLKERLGAILDETAEAIEAQLKRRRDATDATAEQLVNLEEFISGKIEQIARESVEKRAALLRKLVREAQAAAAERAEAERQRIADLNALLDQEVEKSKEVAGKIVEARQKASNRIEQIEIERDQAIAEAREKAFEKALKDASKEAEIARKLNEELVDIRTAASKRIIEELERIAAAAERSAERQAKAQEKARAAIEPQLELLKEISEELERQASGIEGEGNAGEKLAEGYAEAEERLEDLRVALAGFGESADVGGLERLTARAEEMALTLERTAETGFEFGRGFGGEVTQGVDQAAESSDALEEALRRISSEFEGIPEIARPAVEELVREFAEIAESGKATAGDADEFSRRIAAIFENLGVSLKGAGIVETLERVKAEIDKQTESAEKAGAAQEAAAEGADVAWDPVTRKLTTVEEKLGESGDAAESAGVRIERSGEVASEAGEDWQDFAQVILDAAESLDGVAENVEGIGEAGETAGEGLGKIGEAAEAIPDEIIDPAQPDLIRELGLASTEAAAGVVPLADPLTVIAAALERLQVSLPVLQAALPEIAANVAALLEAITANPVEWDIIAASVERISAAATELSATVAPIRELLAALPGLLEQIGEAATPLFDRLQELADAGTFQAIADSITQISGDLEKLPEPLARVQESLESLADNREEIKGVLEDVAAGFRSIIAEDVLAGLDALIVSIEEVNDLLRESLKLVGENANEVERLKTNTNAAKTALEAMVKAIDSQVLPGLESLRGGIEETIESLGNLKTGTEEATQALVDMGEKGAAALGPVLSTLQAINKELAAIVENAAAAATALDQIEPP